MSSSVSGVVGAATPDRGLRNNRRFYLLCPCDRREENNKTVNFADENNEGNATPDPGTEKGGGVRKWQILLFKLKHVMTNKEQIGSVVTSVDTLSYNNTLQIYL